MNLSRSVILEWLEEVKDPEIPTLSLVDLGVVTAVEIDNADVVIEITPTFTGCPALDVMKSEIVQVLKSHGADNVRVLVSYKEAWSSDKITEKGRAAIKRFGLAPPPPSKLFTELEV